MLIVVVGSAVSSVVRMPRVISVGVVALLGFTRVRMSMSAVPGVVSLLDDVLAKLSRVNVKLILGAFLVVVVIVEPRLRGRRRFGDLRRARGRRGGGQQRGAFRSLGVVVGVGVRVLCLLGLPRLDIGSVAVSPASTVAVPSSATSMTVTSMSCEASIFQSLQFASSRARGPD